MSDSLGPVRPLSAEARRKLDREQAAALAGQVRTTVRCPVCHELFPDELSFTNHLEGGDST